VNFEVSLLECNSVRVGRVRLDMDSSEVVALLLLAEREKEHLERPGGLECQVMDNTNAKALARGLESLYKAMQ